MNDMDNFIKAMEEERLANAKNIIKQIESKQSKIDLKTEQIENLQYESNLILDDIIYDIKNKLNYSNYNLFQDLNPNLFRDTQRYKDRKNKDWEDKEEKKKLKNSYKFVIDTIKKNILNNNSDFKLCEIFEYNYGTFYDFEYKYKDKKISLYIPMYNSANKENYKYLLMGYRVLIETSRCCWEQFIANIDYREVANQLESWVKDNEKLD